MIAKGYYQTPQNVISNMLDKLFRENEPLQTDTIIDPGCGRGDFIDGILNWCKKKRHPIPKIVGVELDSSHASYARGKFEDIPQVEIKEQDFLLMNYSKVRYLVGNPPYVPITELSSEEKELYKPIFDSAVERFDLYMLFFEKALSLLRDDGRLVFITPEKYTYVNTAKKLREIIASYHVKEIEQINENSFPGLTNYPTVTTVEKSEPSVTSIENRSGIRKKIHLPRDGSSWLPLFNGYDDPSSTHTLEEICERISCGIATGADRLFIRKKHELDEGLLSYSYSSISGRELKYGEDLPRPEYSIITPYDMDNRLINLENTGRLNEYLLSIKKELGNRSCVEKKAWYAFHETPPMKSILKPKILCKDLSSEVEFWIDAKGKYFPRHSVYYIVPKKPEMLEDIFYFLNSEKTKLWLEKNCQRAAQGYLRLQSTLLKKIPIPDKLYLSSITK